MAKLPLITAFFWFLPIAAIAKTGPDAYTYRVVDQQPQSRELFTQGLEIHENRLYVSSGKYGKSKLLRYTLPSGQLDTAVSLSRNFFAEGLTVLNQHVYQLTWRAKKMLIYRKPDLKLRGSHTLPGDGWGLTNDGTSLIYSDGSATLRVMDPDNGVITRSFQVREGGKLLPRLNELEWVNGAIWANVWLTNRIVVIDPDSGNVTATINLDRLLPKHEQIAGTDVLNGIAFDKSNGAVWVTGKHWPWRYRIELVPEANTSVAHPLAAQRNGT